MRLTLIGHMTVRVELDGLALLTDPWFGPRTWLERRLAPRTLPPALPPEEITTLDAMLVSHQPHRPPGRARTDAGPASGVRRHRLPGGRPAGPTGRSAGSDPSAGRRNDQPGPPHHPRRPRRASPGLRRGGVCRRRQPERLLQRRYPLDPRAPGRAFAPFPLDVALVQAACAHYPFFGNDGMSLPEAAALARALRPRWTVPLHLHCAGKWLDREAGIRIEMGNADRVQAALSAWADSLRAEGLGVQILEPGRPAEYVKRET
jgi:hypothetical protein